MSVYFRFPYSALHLAIQQIAKSSSLPRVLSASISLVLLPHTAFALELSSLTPAMPNNQTVQNPQDAMIIKQIQQAEASQATSTEQADTLDSEALLNENTQSSLQTLPPITLEQLEQMPVMAVDQNLANEIYKTAEQAQQQAQQMLQQQNTVAQQDTSNGINNITTAQLQQIDQAPVNVGQLMQAIAQDQNIAVSENMQGQALNTDVQQDPQALPENKDSLLQRIKNRFVPKLNTAAERVPRISVDVNGAPTLLAKNIDAKLSTYTQESFEDFAASLPQLRSLANQAANAVGYYNAEFKFKRISKSRVRVDVTPNAPVKITEQNIEFSGEGKNQPQFRIIPLIPEQDVGDVFNHGLYEQTKLQIASAASENGFFDGYWQLHDVKVMLPDNTAAVNLAYTTGSRYQLGPVRFQMSDPNKPLPLDLDILNSLAPWQPGDDYATWRINTLANNLTNTRYFNYSLVDATRPDPLIVPLQLPPDLQDSNSKNSSVQNSITQQANQNSEYQNKNKDLQRSATEVQQNLVNETQFAGTQLPDQDTNAQRQLQQNQNQQLSETEKLQALARREKTIPVVVTLNSDKLNSLETGLGVGSDTGVRLRSQYRRAIVNKRGHAFDANIELSEIRQSLDARYSIPYRHPLNDYINLVTGYERETRDNIGPDVELMTDALVLGGERVIKNPLGDWQQTYGLRYRLDRLQQVGVTNPEDIPDAFRLLGTEQESLLLGYETSKTITDNAVNPTQAYKQSYKVQLGSDAILSDTNMAIVSSTLAGIYSIGRNDNHQLIGRADAAYIFAENFDKVPYNQRYFAGGDQSIRGFDYKSLGPEVEGFRIGGQALAVASLEYNYQFRPDWRAALFSDVGNAYDEKFSNPTVYSLGVGMRWKSPIGPIRIDVAAGVSDPNRPIRLHFFIGPQL